MAIAFDAASQGDVLTATSLTVAHTVAGTDRILLVAVQTYDGGLTPATPTVTYNAVAMTELTGANILFGSTLDERLVLFYLVAPATGTNNIVVTVSSAQDEIGLAAVSYTGVDQTTPLDTAATEVEASVTVTALAVASATGDVVIDAIAWYSETITVGAGQTQRVLNNNTTVADSVAMSDEPGATSVDMSWSFAAAAYPGHIVVNMNATSAISKTGTDTGVVGETASMTAAQTPTDSGVLGETASKVVTSYDAAGTDTGVLSEVAASTAVGTATDTGLLGEMAKRVETLGIGGFPDVKVEAAFGHKWNEIEPQGHFTFDGTVGEYIWTADVNLLDADTAHMHQSNPWAASGVDLTVSAGVVDADGFGSTDGVLTTTAGVIARFSVNAVDVPFTVGDVTVSMDVHNKNAVAKRIRLRFVVDGVTHYISSELTVPANTKGRYSYTVNVPSGTLITHFWVDVWKDSVTGDEWNISKAQIAEGTASTFVPSLRIVGDFDVRTKAAAVDWASGAARRFLGFVDVSANAGFYFGVSATNVMQLAVGDGATYQTTDRSVAGLVDGSASVVRGTFAKASGTFELFYDAVSQGTNVVAAFTPTAVAVTGIPMEVGNLGDGLNQNFAGDFYWAEVRDGIDGPVVARADGNDPHSRGGIAIAGIPTTFANGQTWTDETGRTWTVNV